MLTAWRLFNFKSVRDDTTIALAPLTVLAGANSSGKSTVLQSMLMIAQTLQSPVTERPIVLNGPMVRLGTFHDVRSYGSDAASVLVGFEFRHSGSTRWRAENLRTARVAVAFGVRAAEEASLLHPQLISTNMVVRDTSTGAEREYQIDLSLDSPQEIADAVLEGDLRGLDATRVFDLRVVSDSGATKPYYSLFPETHFLPDPESLEPRDKSPSPPHLSRDMSHDSQEVQRAIEGIRYLGPLRDEPRALYPLSTTADTTDVGLRGENTAAVYNLHRNRLVRYIPSSNFPPPALNAPSLDRAPRNRSLEAAVLDWLRYLGVVDTLTTRDLGNLGHELKVTTPGVAEPHNLTHVGAGVSQVLPIVVMCLLAEEGSTILIEQPELHLHPRVQTLLGDFFLAASLAGRQVIVETHSEYLVNRLRYRIAASEGEDLAQTVKTYFAEKNEKGASMFRDVKVNRYGAITEWPKGFFDQSQREIEQILLAGAQKKKAERSRGGNDGSGGA